MSFRGSDDSQPGDLACHVPVLVQEVLHYLQPLTGQVIVDATVGGGGHAAAILERIGPDGRLIGLDRDPGMLSRARRRLGGSVTLLAGNFAQLAGMLRYREIGPVDAVLMDLGVASDQLDDPARGFSFSRSGPIDMRMNPNDGTPASRFINQASAERLADVIYEFGEVRCSHRLARAIVAARQRQRIETTDQLAEIVRRAMPRAARRPRIDPATLVFQAIRIAVNDELAALDAALAALPECLKSGGRAIVISFHSLEDRRVKFAFRERTTWECLTRKPVEAGEAERLANPRARSAKLRAAQRISQELDRAI